MAVGIRGMTVTWHAFFISGISNRLCILEKIKSVRINHSFRANVCVQACLPGCLPALAHLELTYRPPRPMQRAVTDRTGR